MNAVSAQRTAARILVCGGRRYANRAFVYSVLDRYRKEVPIDCIIHGAAAGADTLAGEWALDRGVSVVTFPAAWEAHGRAAGAIRNGRMLREGRPDIVVAFPGGTGTADMVRRAIKGGVRVCDLRDSG